MLDRGVLRDRVRGLLIAGAAGDALGYAVEFTSLKGIQAQFGMNGIQEYALDRETGTAIISDDTQMTLFTANGLLLSEARGKRPAAGWIYTAYMDWLSTQMRTRHAEKLCWLREIPELNARRAPGNTCLQALNSGDMGSVDEPINNSKGCGGVMRVAPVAVYGLLKGWDIEKTVRLGAEAAAITHGHDLGWMSGAALVDIIYRVLGGEDMCEAVRSSAADMEKFFAQSARVQELSDEMHRAIELTWNDLPDIENVKSLGEGWVGDEALYIAIYCAVKYADNPDMALTVSVNHGGDSDSTGAVMGNILGAAVGYAALGEKWKQNLELHDLILEVADDLCAVGGERSDAWMKKYGK